MLLVTMMVGCSGTLCEGNPPRDAEELEHQLQSLGYGEFGDSGFGQPDSAILQDQESWESYAAEGGIQASELSVDFSSELVFVNSWVDGGCDSISYTALLQVSSLRLRREETTGGCDAFFPQLDFVVVEHRGATDVDFCETVTEWERRFF